MKSSDSSVPVIVFPTPGNQKRFIGKYKDPDEPDPKKRWKRIPGGKIPAEFDTKEKALLWARRWYELEIAERVARTQAPTTAKNWSAVCDDFAEEVDRRRRGADGSKDELKKRAKFLRRSPLLCSRPVAEHDQALAITWVRDLLAAPKRGSSGEPRDPLTVRNVARVLGEIYKYACITGAFPSDRKLPTESDEFREEVNAAIREKQKLGKVTRVACPVAIVVKVATSREVSEWRRIVTRVYFYTGVRPGELHGLTIADVREEHGVLFLDVHAQWTLARTGFPSKLAAPKTRHGVRKIPIHASLVPYLREWIDNGWRRHVGRDPKAEDFLFPDESGDAFREDSCAQFHEDLRLAGCETTHKGVKLELYSLRHSFATAARRAGVSSDTRDRVLGHGPRDTKAKHYEDEDLPVDARELAKMPTLEESTSAITPEPPPTRTPPPTEALVTTLVASPAYAFSAMADSSMITAEEKRFELLDGLPHRRFSKPLPSTTRPLLQVGARFVA